MTVLQAAIFPHKAPTAAQIQTAIRDLNYPVSFSSDENFDGENHRVNTSMDGRQIGFEFSCELIRAQDASSERENIFSGYGGIAWITGSKGDLTQLMATLYLLRAALTVQPGTYWDGEIFHGPDRALSVLDDAISQPQVDIPPHLQITRHRSRELPPMWRIILGLLLGIILGLLISRN